MASTDGLRVGDSERESVAAELREHYAQGRLTLEEFQRRLDAAMAAETRGDLDRIISDLPSISRGDKPLPASGAASGRQHPRGSGFWPGGRRQRAAFGRIGVLLAAMGSCLVLFDLIAGFRFPWAGRAGILVVIMAILRRLLRKIFGLRRRRF
jgi:hypothetical protein